jgi:DNA-binding MurR/RpiR family transcriptional regulator
LGFAKFAEFKKIFSEHAHAELTSSNKPAETPAENDLFTLGAEEDIAAITATLSNPTNRDNLPVALDMIKNAKHIYIFGGRRSYPMAQFFATGLRLLGITAHEIFSGHDDCWDHLRLATKEDLVIGITLPRYSQDVISAMKKLQEKKIPTMLLTDTGLSPALPYADLAFYCSIPTSYYLPSCTGVHALINVICRGVNRQMDANLYKQYQDNTLE